MITHSTPQFNSATQLQESDSTNRILPKIKKADANALFILLKPLMEVRFEIIKLDENNSENNKELIITDLGCGEGQMLLTLLKLLHENLEYFCMFNIKIYAYDAEKSMIGKYEENFSAKNDRPYLKNVSVEKAEVKKIQEINFEKSDVFLASHSFYYCREVWDTSHYNNHKNIAFNQHIITRLLNRLKEQGMICVILQSNKDTQIKGHYKELVSNHENFENLMYPLKIMFDTQGTKIVENSQRDTFTNAEIFESCVKQYRKILAEEKGRDLNVLTSQSMAVVELGDINFELNRETQKYEQSETVTEILNFYTRKLYKQFKHEEQKKILDHIQINCMKSDNTLVMCHVNCAFLICPAERIISVEQLENPNPTWNNSFSHK